MSSHMFFTSISRYLNSLTVSKDILKRLSVTWNCKCCNYTGSVFCPTHIVRHFPDFCMAVGGANIPAVWIYCVLCFTSFRSLKYSNIRGFLAITLGRWTGLFQYVAYSSRFLPLHAYLKNVLENVFSAHGCASNLTNTLFIRHRTEDITSWMLSFQIVFFMGSYPGE